MLIKKMLFLTGISIILVMWMNMGCSDSPTGSGNDDDTTQTDTNSIVLVDSANIELGNVIDEMVNTTLNDADSSFRPRDIDFSEVNDLYERALVADPSNNDAKFGSAFTQLMMFLADDNFNILVDRFKHTYDTLTFDPLKISRYIPEISFGTNVLPEGIPLTTSGFTSLLPAPFKLDRELMSAAEDDPMISDIQNIFDTTLIPKIQSAQNKLLEVLNDPNYTFEITPAMQGNEGASTIIIDGSDIRILLAGLYSLESAIHIFLARDLDITDYSVSGVETAVNRSSSFLSLKTGGAAHMVSAKNDILSAESQLEDAINSLIAEIDSNSDQFNDLIKVYPDDRQDLLDIKDSLMFYRTYFDGPKELKIVWYNWVITGYDEQWGWPIYGEERDSFLVDVDISKFFDYPMDNPKNFIPDYVITMDELNDIYKSFADANFSSDRYWASMDSIFGLTYPNDTPYFAIHLPDDTTSDEFYTVLYGYWDNNNTIFGWSDVGSWCSSGDTNLYCYYSNMNWQYIDYYDSPDRIGVCYNWTADDFSGWNWPDPTFRGLLPTYTNADIKDLIFEDTLRWKKSECDTLDISF